MIKDTSGQFCVGDDITLVDICLIPQLYNALRFGVDIKKYEKIFEIYSKCIKLDAFVKASPEKQPDYPGDKK